jgi:phenylacetate-CoA ligase
MQIEQALLSMPEVGQNYVIELFREGYMDQLRVKVEIKNEFFVEDMRALTALQKRITARLRDEILITPRVELIQSKSLPQCAGKAERVRDLREKNL